MTKTLLLIAALCLTACGKPPVANIDPKAQHYFDSFMARAADHGLGLNLDITIQFADMPPTTELGDCQMGSGVITLDYPWWSVLGEDDRQELVDHEMGHCFLGRGHNDALMPGKVFPIPDSVMDAWHFDGWLYAGYRGHYTEELFRYGQNCDEAGC